VLSDAALVALAVEPPKDAGAFAARRELRAVARSPKVWLDAIDKALALSEDALPPLTLSSTGPPPPRLWADRDPIAAARLVRARDAMAAYASERVVPVENLLTPDLLRRVLWTPPDDLGEAAFAAALRGGRGPRMAGHRGCAHPRDGGRRAPVTGLTAATLCWVPRRSY
jgi:ribonuclease D